MAEVTHVATLQSGGAGLGPVTSLDAVTRSGAVVLQAYTSTGVRVSSWELGDGAASKTGAYDPGQGIGVARLDLTFASGARHRLQDDQIGRLIAEKDLTLALDQTALSLFRVETAWIERGNTNWLFAEDPLGGLMTYQVRDSALAGSGTLRLTPDRTTETGGLEDLLHVVSRGQDYLITVGAESDAVRIWQVNSNGTLTETSAVPDGQGIGDPQAVAAVELSGVTYLAVAGAGSGSISLYQMTATGGLIRADHVLDDSATTRFQNVHILETAEVDGRVYLVAAGTDQGISVLEVLPGGRLLHRASFADTVETTLDQITDVALWVNGATLQIFVSSGSAAGVTQLLFDPERSGLSRTGGSGADSLAGAGQADVLIGGSGNDTLSGGSGSDVLLDGPGRDTLIGGAAPDIFVLSADNERDTIRDFRPGQDRLDLSAWPMLYDVSQLTILSTSNGARLLWRGEELRIITETGAPLTAAQLTNADLFNLNRPPLGTFIDRMTISGTEAPNRLEGPEINVEILGMGGNDVLISRGGDNLLSGGEGRDLVSYEAAPSGVEADLDAGRAQVGGDWRDQLVDIENVTGSAFGDRLVGDAGRNQLRGEAGADRLMGLSGQDQLFGGDGLDTLEGGAGADTLWGNGEADLLYGGDGDDQVRGGGSTDRLFAGAGNDFVIGNTGKDTLYGEDGDDEMYGSAGADSIFGGAGADWISGGGSRDTIQGDAGNDTIYGNTGDDTVQGGDGADSLFGSAGSDQVQGQSGNDSLDGGSGSDTLRGDGGDDFLSGAGGKDTLVGGTGNDALYGNTGRDDLRGEDGNDRLFGGAGSDTLQGQSGRDSLVGGSGADNLDGGSGSDTLSGGKSDDWLSGGDNADTLLGGNDRDTLYGNAGADDLQGENGSDTLIGGADNDTLWGQSGADRLDGGSGSDTLIGGAGRDRLAGGSGNDRLTGGSGADTFVYTAGADRIDDFAAGADLLVLDDALWSGTLRPDQVINRFGEVSGRDYVLDFGGGDTLTVAGGIDPGALAALISFV